jgi:hypothetical protein
MDVRRGVRIEVRLDDRLSSQDAATGQKFTFTTTRDFDVGDLVVPRGTKGWGFVELSEPRAGTMHGGRLNVSVRGLLMPGGRAIPVSLPPAGDGPNAQEPERTSIVPIPIFGAIVTLDADASGNVVLPKGETFVVITTSTGTPEPIPHSEPSS